MTCRRPIASRRAARNGGGQGSRAGSGHHARPKSTFISLRGGTGELVDSLVARLDGDLRLNATVQAIERDRSGYRLVLDGAPALQAGAVILATPAFVAARLLHELAPEAADGLGRIRYVSTGTISLAFRQADVRSPYAGAGLVVPASERRPINAITWSSVKFDDRAPAGSVLLRAFFGGSRSPQSMELDDGELLHTVRHELAELLGLEAEPLFHRIYRWPQSNPQYDVGHLDQVAAIEAALPPGILVTGSPYLGVGIPDCVKQAREAARRAAEHLAQSNPR